jgi:outer membrane biosynthesis protein TonB
MDAVTEVLLDRSRDAQKLSRMVVASLLLHGTLLTVIFVLPALLRPTVDNAHVMTITLGGAPGPQQGRNTITAKAVQQVAPDTAKPKLDTPPALVKPEMVEPIKNAKTQPKTAAKPEQKKETPQLHGSKPTEGPEVKQGMAKVETHGAAIPWGGLATGGGGGGAARTDYADFCCPEYLDTLTALIKRNWQQNQNMDGENVVSFTIHRDGTITNVLLDDGKNQILNLASQRAIITTARVPALPAAFSPDHLTVHLTFQYTR